MPMPAVLHRSLLAAASGLSSFLVLVAPLDAQSEQAVLRGRVLDARDSAVAGAAVVLHAVTGDAGVELDRDTADDAGAFRLDFDFREGPLYFIATRLDDRIYMAEPFRQPPVDEIVLRAGPGVPPLDLQGFEPAPVSAPPSAAAADESAHAGWWVAAIAAIVVGFVAWLVHRGRRRAPRARELLVEIARLDEQRARAGDAGSEESYRARRAELRARLVEALELDDDADRH